MVLFNLFIAYTILGFIFIIFNKKFSYYIYNLILYYTDKLKLSEVFIFKVDNSNRNSMFFLTRSFTILLGIAIISLSLFYLK